MEDQVLNIFKEKLIPFEQCDWYNKFMNNVNLTPRDCQVLLSHRDLDVDTIVSSAFLWQDSPEGSTYWHEIYQYIREIYTKKKADGI